MITTRNLGFPRVGQKRELKKALESYWRNEISIASLEEIGDELQQRHRQLQSRAGIDLIPVGDFSYYDHVLDTSFLFNVIPERFQQANNKTTLNTYFTMAKGQAPDGSEAPAEEMTKWFDTNYHYIVPEFNEDQSFKLNDDRLLDSIKKAQQLRYHVKPVLLGPLSFLWLGKSKHHDVDKLSLLQNLLPAYTLLLQKIKQLGVTWVQIDEPILVLDLPKEWLAAYRSTYKKVSSEHINLLLTTYFGTVEHHLELFKTLAVQGLHLDCCRAPEQLEIIAKAWPKEKVLSIGVVDRRNI